MREAGVSGGDISLSSAAWNAAPPKKEEIHENRDPCTGRVFYHCLPRSFCFGQCVGQPLLQLGIEQIDPREKDRREKVSENLLESSK